MRRALRQSQCAGREPRDGGRRPRHAADRQPRLRRDAAARARRGGADLRRRAARRPTPITCSRRWRTNACRPTFFMVGRQARANPELAWQIRAAGHTVGTHTQNHPLHRMSPERAAYEIDTGIASVGAALGSPRALAPFFRFPGLFRTTEAEYHLRSRGLMAWSVDVDSYDWKKISASHMLQPHAGRAREAARRHPADARRAAEDRADAADAARRAQGARLPHRPCGAGRPASRWPDLVASAAPPQRRRRPPRPAMRAAPARASAPRTRRRTVRRSAAGPAATACSRRSSRPARHRWGR